MKKKVLVLALIALIGLAFIEIKNRYALKARNESQFLIINWRMTPSYITNLNNPVLFTFHLKDRKNHPITDAHVMVEANMNHAGMVPVSNVAIHDQNGFYKTNLKLTMNGDWILFLTITKSDGEIIKKELSFSTMVKK